MGSIICEYGRCPQRRRFIGVLILLIAPWLTPAADWPQWRGLNRDGVWPETGLDERFPAAGLKIAWRAAIGRGWSSPVVAQGRVYVTDVQAQRPKADERVLCFSEADGRLEWTHAYPVKYPDWAFEPNGSGPRATPIVHDDRLFTLGGMGLLLCLDTLDGRVVWQRDLARDYAVREFSGITASPLIEGDLLILNPCGKPSAGVIAFDRSTGREVWKALDDSFTYSSPIVCTAGGQRQLIIWSQEAVTSLNPATGRIWWRERMHTPGDQAVSTPVYGDDRLLVGGLMFQLDTRKPAATVLWPDSRAVSRRVLSNTSTALLQSNYLYSATTSGELVCLETATGRLLWQTNSLTAAGNGSSIHLVPSGDAVYFFTDQGELGRARLGPTGYSEFSRASLLKPTSPFGTKPRAWVPPAFANRRVLARNDQEIVSAWLGAAR
jgi:outer membrane protein assembly factor BamB